MVIGFLCGPGAARKATSYPPESVGAPLRVPIEGTVLLNSILRGPEKMADNKARRVERREAGMFLHAFPVAVGLQLQRDERGAG